MNSLADNFQLPCQKTWLRPEYRHETNVMNDLETPRTPKPVPLIPRIIMGMFVVGLVLWVLWMVKFIHQTRETREQRFFVPVNTNPQPVRATSTNSSP